MKLPCNPAVGGTGNALACWFTTRRLKTIEIEIGVKIVCDANFDFDLDDVLPQSSDRIDEVQEKNLTFYRFINFEP